MIDKSKKSKTMSALYIYQQTLGLLMAASHQPPMVRSFYPPHNFLKLSLTTLQFISFMLLNLCKHPQYLEPLRNEARNIAELSEWTKEATPLLDSFLKETARLNPLRTGKTAL